MSVHRATARLLGADGSLAGEGRAYLHLRQPSHQPQVAGGTLSLDWWDDAAPAPYQLDLDGGPRLALRVHADNLSGCVVGRILRYSTDWPGLPGG